MKQEDKQLLLQDLCARLSYGTKINVNGEEDTLLELGIDTGWVNASYDIEDVKLYLRPMSSMTEKEKKKLKEIHFYYTDDHIVNDEDNDFKPIIVDEIHCSCIIDWLNSHHFDYRGLIEKGIALEAPVDMYSIELKE